MTATTEALPPGWRRARLGEVAHIRNNKVEPRIVPGLPYVALEHLQQGLPRLLGWAFSDNATSTKTRFKAGDVLFGKLRPNLRKAAAAPFEGVCSTDILPIYPLEGLSPEFLVQLCHWTPFQEHVVTTAEGTKMPRTSWRSLSRFPILLPPLPEQRKIAEILPLTDHSCWRDS